LEDVNLKKPRDERLIIINSSLYSRFFKICNYYNRILKLFDFFLFFIYFTCMIVGHLSKISSSKKKQIEVRYSMIALQSIASEPFVGSHSQKP
jgi:hypothetical protein